MKGYEKYQAAMIEIIRPVLESKTDEQGEALSEAYKNYLFGLDGPKQVNDYSSS